jgi:hypothetical protein
LASTGDEGNTVNQMFLNTQSETYGGDGWLRIVEFLEDGTTVRVRAYSPLWDLERTHSDFAFEFEVSPLPEPEPIDGDYNRDGFVDAADYVVWRKTAGTDILFADGTGDEIVNPRDYYYWWERFGNGSIIGALNAPVPEPSFAVSLIAAVSCFFCDRRGRRDGSRN